MFKPNFKISEKLLLIIAKLERLNEQISNLPITPKVLSGLRESARLESTRYSTYIEGNRLTEEQIEQAIHQHIRIPNRSREEKEVLGYYAALEEVEQFALAGKPVSQTTIQLIHALVMGGGKKKVKPSPYRTIQNVIRDAGSRRIVYLPPEAIDVPQFMADLVEWLLATKDTLPHPIRAAIAHYQFATIHPYIDGNGRTARLLATLVLHKNGYGLKGIYSLEEYYAKDLSSYYQALDISPSHNYYQGREEADISGWIEYFCEGMLKSFQKIQAQAKRAQSRGSSDVSSELKKLTPRQRKVLTLFEKQDEITSQEIADLLKIEPRTARQLCQQWAHEGFLEILNASKKARTYGLNPALASSLK